jgi:hypothetical protein
MTVDIQPIPGQCLMLPGHDTPRADILTAARAHLLAAGMDAWDADDALESRQGLVVRAWWGGALGFVGQDHPDAQPVTVVNVAPAER